MSSQRTPAHVGQVPGRFGSNRSLRPRGETTQKEYEGSESRQDLADRLMTDMDPELLTFLRTTINSFIKWDLVHFFNRNPWVIDTAENITRYVGRDVNATQRALTEMATQGLIVTESIGSVTAYSLSSNRGTRSLLQRFVEASTDRQFRAKAIYQIIRGLR